MEWAKAHSRHPLPVELGFSGAPRPPGADFREHGSGEPWLEARIARRYGVPRDHVYLIGGTSLANFVAIAAFCGPGRKVAVETPRYAPLAEIPRGLGARVVDVPRRPDGRLGPLPRGARLAVVTTPHNPTGRLLREPDWRALRKFADRGGVVLVDEVYRDLQRRPPPVAATLHPRFLTTASVTKAYGLGALRIGWVLGVPGLLARVRRVDNLVSVQCATPSLRRLRQAWPRLDALRRAALRPVRANLLLLRRSGLPFIEPEAGLTALVEVGDGDAVAEALERRGVGVARGSFFGAPRHVRVFLGADPRTFARGLRALVDQAPRGRRRRAISSKTGR
jgi:aspartate/methionine/tyrosine aminotransferase